MITRKFFLITLLCLLSITGSYAQLFDWRGPDRTGVYNESGLLKFWPVGGPKLIWEFDGLGEGYGSVTITDKAIYVTGRKNDVDVLTALSFDGKKLWSVNYGQSWMKNFTGTRGIPVVFNGDIYLISGAGELVCVKASGEIKWKKNHYEMYESTPLMFGISESPLVFDDKVIASPGRNKASLVAFNNKTGDVIWEAEPLNEGPQYINPKLIIHNGRKIIVSITESYVVGIDANTGKLLWKLNYEEINKTEGRPRKNHANTPLYRDGKLLIANGYNYVSFQVELSKDGTEAKVVWENRDLGPHHGGMVLLGDYVYGTSYMSNSMGNWVCVDWNTGKTMWSEKWENKGSIISADNMLYIFEEKSGNVGLVNPTPTKFDLVSSFQITKGDGPFWAHPVINNGRLYLRHGEVLMVHAIK